MILLLLALLSSPSFAAEKTMASVVSSKEWVVRRAPSREEEFRGDVRYKAGGNEFTSDWALYKHEGQLWRARGSVVVRHTLSSGDVVTGRGDEARYDQKHERGEVTAKGRVGFTREPAEGGEPDRGEGGRLTWAGRESASLEDGAHVWGPRLEGWADRAEYDGPKGAMTLSGGRPVLVKGEGLGTDWVGAVKADEITADREARKLSADGRVKGWLEFRELPERPKRR